MADDTGWAWVLARRLRTTPVAYRVARRVYTMVNSVRRPVHLDGIPGPVHRNDLMIDRSVPGTYGPYVDAGRRAVALLDDALATAGRSLGESDVLDFGCGHGRVVRHLAGAAGSVSACDLDASAVRFCASAFGARPIPGDPDLSRVDLGSFDAVWMGSVITHHPPNGAGALLTGMAAHVRPGGVLVATGADASTLVFDLAAAGREWMAPSAERLRDELAASGATYLAYPQHPDGTYGLGYQTAEWLTAVSRDAGLEPLWDRPRPWGAQVVYGWCRTT